MVETLSITPVRNNLLRIMKAVLSLVPKDFAMTVERDETPQHIEMSFVEDVR